MTTTIYEAPGKSLKLNSAVDVAEIVAGIESLNPTEIRLSGNSYGVEATLAIADAMSKTTNLKILSFSDMFTSRLKDEIPLSLAAFVKGCSGKELVEVDFSDNAFGPTGAEPFKQLLINHRTLLTLKLNNTGLGIGGGKLISSALIESATLSKANGSDTVLETIIAGRNRLEGPGGMYMSLAFEHFANSLKTVKMPQNSIRPEGMAAIIKSLAKCPLLETLDLQDNTFTEPGSLALAEALPGWKNLRVLNVGDCLLSAKGCIIVLNALTGIQSTLEDLNLQFNEMNQKGAELVPNMLKNKANLVKFELNGNEFDGDGAIVEQIRSVLEAHGHPDALGELDEMEFGSDFESDEEEEGEPPVYEPEDLDELSKAVSGLAVE